MKQYLIRLAIGPAVMVLGYVTGMAVGYRIGWIAACVIVPIALVGAGLLAGRLVGGTAAMLAVVLAALPGLVAARSYRNLRELETGEFVDGVALAELAELHVDRFTINDGVAQRELAATSSHTAVWGGPSDRQRVTSRCEAFPISSAAWTRAEPVRFWRFGFEEPAPIRELARSVFRVGAPNELCREAIDRAIAKHHLATASDAIYLEALVTETSDVRENRLRGPFAVALLGGLWMVVVTFGAARDAWARRRV